MLPCVPGIPSSLIFCLHVFRVHHSVRAGTSALKLVGKYPSSRSGLFLKRPPQDTRAPVQPLYLPHLWALSRQAAVSIFLAACGCWENRCQACGSWEFTPALQKPLTSGCKCQLRVVREGGLRRMDSDRQASANRTQSPREKSWQGDDLHIHILGLSCSSTLLHS